MADWIIGFIQQHGYLAIVALMLLENVFPPIPSELIMPFSGLVAARGDLSVVGVVAAGAFGSLLGTLPWYVAGRQLSSARLSAWVGRHGRLLTVSPADLHAAERWFQRHQGAAVFAGRLVPAVRSVISAPAGFARMPLWSFLLWSAAGSLLWVGLLVGLGYALGNRYDRVSEWLDPVTWVVFGGALALYLYRVVTFRGTSAKS